MNDLDLFGGDAGPALALLAYPNDGARRREPTPARKRRKGLSA